MAETPGKDQKHGKEALESAAGAVNEDNTDNNDDTLSNESSAGGKASCGSIIREESSAHQIGEEEESGGTCWKCRGTGNVCKKRVEKLCPVCRGTGIIKRARKRCRSEKERAQTSPRKYPHFEAPGPTPPGDATVLSDPTLYPQEDEEVCFLVGKWKIFQKVR